MEVLRVRTGARDQLVDITDRVQQVVSQRGVKSGLCVVFVPHTTAGVTINENADPDVVTDMLTVLDKLVPWRANYRHGEGNSAAHVKASLLGSSVTVIIEEGRLQLGTWQGIYLAEFDGPRER
ncbi:secondary thiamine-phosphate synthase enzyme YjbQ, partial [Carboxydocella sp. ULO1]